MLGAMDRYQIGSLIGEGGMALVHEAARRLADDRQDPVVLKRLRPEHEPDQEARARLDLEAQIGIELAHPHLVKVHDYDRVGEHRCLVMERVDGLSLADLARLFWLARRERLPFEAVRIILMRVVMALAYVHEHRILHRDVSPANILVSRRGEVKLADFGLARVLAAPRTTPSFKGTPAYASPEAIRGEDLEPSADLYSLAALLYELLMGEPPHGRGDHHAIAHRQDPASGWSVAPVPEEVPMDLHALIAGLLLPSFEVAALRVTDRKKRRRTRQRAASREADR
jgi:eukaryotic-like serine/threonine-protein kinase